MFENIIVHNHKGGSGKTTLSVHLARWLAEHERPAVLLDTDTQSNAIRWITGYAWEGDDAVNVGDLPLAAVWMDDQIAQDLAVERNATLVIDTPPSDDLFRQLPRSLHPSSRDLLVIPCSGRMAIDGAVKVLEEAEDYPCRTVLVANGVDPVDDSDRSEVGALIELEQVYDVTVFRAAIPPNAEKMGLAERDGIPFWETPYADRTHTGKALKAFCRWVERGCDIAEADASFSDTAALQPDLRERLWS
jgi:cellulose biosynthesis protein BcsQ